MTTDEDRGAATEPAGLTAVEFAAVILERWIETGGGPLGVANQRVACRRIAEIIVAGVNQCQSRGSAGTASEAAPASPHESTAEGEVKGLVEKLRAWQLVGIDDCNRAALALERQARALALHERNFEALGEANRRAEAAESALAAERQAYERAWKANDHNVQTRREQLVEQLKHCGLEPGVWDKYRGASPPPWPQDGTDELIICDALTQEGVAAWPGDATSCVAQIVGAYARALAAERRMREEADEATRRRCRARKRQRSGRRSAKPE